MASLDVTTTIGGNTIVITKAQVVVRRIKLKLSVTESCSDVDGVDDACEETAVGPLLVDLPLNTTGVTSITASIPEGTYREIEFRIHKPGDTTAADVAFRTANPTFADISMRVEGTFNGTAFVFTSDLNEKFEREFNPPVVVDASSKNVTVQLDVATWFQVGGALVNPTTANKGGANENAVKSNVRTSIRALEDNDRNGR